MALVRSDGRLYDSLRHFQIEVGINPYAEGSAKVVVGNTEIIVTATLERDLPEWRKGSGAGWITAEYGMLPRACGKRTPREAALGKQTGRTQEIQRLIGRSLRAAVDLSLLSNIAVRVDCDVIVADGSTRTAAINGGWVALYQALSSYCAENDSSLNLLNIKQIAAVSVGIVKGEPMLDLSYEEDSAADFDLNLVFNSDLQIIEIQGTAEKRGLSNSILQELIGLGLKGAGEVFAAQRDALKCNRSVSGITANYQ